MGGVAVVSQFVVGYYMKGQIVDLYTYSFIDIFCNSIHNTCISNNI